jgi:secreted PhoX family phosphatase
MQSLREIIEKLATQKSTRRSFIHQVGLGLLIANQLDSQALAQALNPSFAQSSNPSFAFEAPSGNADPHLKVPQGYHADVLISWGDHLKKGKLKDYHQINSKWQKNAFGYNNDFLAYHQLDHVNISHHGLLSVNHEYNIVPLMFPKTENHLDEKERLMIQMFAVGHSVIEVQRSKHRKQDRAFWSVVYGSHYHRRFNVYGPKMEIKGPAQKSDRMKTSEDSKGLWIDGTFSNCAGGTTPWGTTLIAEENFNLSFLGQLEELHIFEDFSIEEITFDRQADFTKKLNQSNAIKKIDSITNDPNLSLLYLKELRNYVLSDISKYQTQYEWHKIEPRFDLSKEPHEINRFGWIVEYDPQDPNAEPIKRTALGRFKHECATTILSQNQKAVVYSGDDQSDEHLYRFVSKEAFDPKHPKHNLHLLDEGELQVAQFNENGKVKWLPLVYGQDRLIPEFGFWSQADVMIECRRAAKLMGATPLDRPEDIEVDPKNKHIYVMLTGSKTRKNTGPASPRAKNPYGHILEIMPIAGDDEALEMQWQVYLLGNGPQAEDFSDQSKLKDFEQVLRNPDNAMFDPLGRLWVTSDYDGKWDFSYANGLWLTQSLADEKIRRFCALPRGAEPCGPCMTPDGKTLFLSIQHPAESTSFEEPSTRWPDFQPNMPPRPSIVTIEHEDHRIIGT